MSLKEIHDKIQQFRLPAEGSYATRKDISQILDFLLDIIQELDRIRFKRISIKPKKSK